MVFAKVKQKDNRVIVRFSGFPKDDNECVAYMSLMDKIYAQNIQFVILFDARHIGWLTWKHIQMQAAFMTSKESLTRKYMVRCAIIVDSFTARSVLTALFKVRKPAAPCQIFTSLEQGKEYLRSAKLPRHMEPIVASINDMAKYNSEIQTEDMQDAENAYLQAST